MHRTTLIAGMFVAILSASALQAAAPRKAPQNGPYSWSTGAYQYDAAGNVTAIGVNTFTYDPLSRLAGSHVEAPDSESDQTYIYDPFGNLIRVTTSGIPTDITTSTATNHVDIAAYDDSGSVSQLQPPNSAYVYGFHYDALDALSEETVDGAPASYFVYTASDERLRIERGNVVHWRIRGLRPKVARDIQRSGSTWSVDRDYFYRGGSPLAAMTPTTIEHFTLDALESPRLLTNASGAKLAVHTYLPFGRELGSAAADGEPLKFTGHERDDDPAGDANPLDYMHARYYTPSLARFLAVDRASGTPGGPQSWNRYTYALNSPVKAIDPDGNRLP